MINIFNLLFRIGNHLKADLGKDWHDKLPKRDDINWTNTNTNTQPTPAKVEPVHSTVIRELKICFYFQINALSSDSYKKSSPTVFEIIFFMVLERESISTYSYFISPV